MHWIARLAWIICLLPLPLWADRLEGEHIIACGDTVGWPPFHYRQNGLVQGFDVDVLNRILTPAGVPFTVSLVPWKRCLMGSTNAWFHIVLSASTSPDREQTYALTDSYYQLNSSYVYDRNRFPDGLDIEHPDGLSRYRVCGLRGYNYIAFGIPNEGVDRTSTTLAEVSEKTLAGDCDLFLVRYEVLVGFSPTRKPLLIQGLTEAPLPGVENESFYMMVSKAYPHHNALLDLLNQGIRRMKADGTLDALLDQYVPPR